MVLPAITAESKVVAGSAKKTISRKKVNNDLSGPSNQVRFQKPANDNSPSKVIPGTANKLTREKTTPQVNETNSSRNSRDPYQPKYPNKNLDQKIKTRLNVGKSGKIKAMTASIRAVIFTIPLYIFQIYGAVLIIVGVGAMELGENFALGVLDYIGITSYGGLIFMNVGIFMTLMASLFTFLIALAIFILSRVDCFSGLSIIILAFAFAASFMPVLSLAPWMWAWCFYVGMSQKRT